jgi:hypothetical protein
MGGHEDTKTQREWMSHGDIVLLASRMEAVLVEEHQPFINVPSARRVFIVPWGQRVGRNEGE